MARGSDPDSRPISVAELLARAKEQDAENAAAGSQPTATPGTGRRHRGGKGAVSVAELTGEIPRVNDAVPPPTRDFNSADVSKRAQDTDDSSAPTPGEPERPVLSRPRDVETPTDRRAEGSPEGPDTESAKNADETASMPAADRGGREDSQIASNDATQAGDEHSDEETTGVIAPVQAYSQVDSDPDHIGDDGRHDFRTAAEREADFQRYRNFEDVDDSPAARQPSKRKRGLFGFGRKTDESVPVQSAPERADDHAGADTDHQVTQVIPAFDDSGHRPAHPDSSTRSMPIADGSNQAESEQAAPHSAAETATTATGASAGRYLRFDVDNDEQTRGPGPDLTKSDARQPDPREVDLTGTDPVAAGMPAGLREVGPTEEHGPLIHPQVHPSAEETDAVKARLTGSTGDTHEVGTNARTTRGDDSAQAADGGSRHSPTVQWLILIGQVLAGLAVGVALFWGFTELWRWNVYFALVLAVAVIFGMVTLVHVVRRSQDLISTLLALGVGLLVTIGPLVLLLVAGD